MSPLSTNLYKFIVPYCVLHVTYLDQEKCVDFWPILLIAAAQNVSKDFQVRLVKRTIQDLFDLIGQSEHLMIIEKKSIYKAVYYLNRMRGCQYSFYWNPFIFNLYQRQLLILYITFS